MILDFSSHPFSFTDARSRGQLRAFGLHATDGDTIVAIVDLGFSISMKMKLRILGINTPETVGTTGEVYKRALAAMDFTAGLIVDYPLLVRTFQSRTGEPHMSFQRYIAEVDIAVDWTTTLRSLAGALLAQGLADPV